MEFGMVGACCVLLRLVPTVEAGRLLNNGIVKNELQSMKVSVRLAQ